MSYICYICGKGTEFGGNRKHRRGSSGGGGAWRFKSQRTLRTWKPNLRTVVLSELGKEFKEKICMKCYKKLRKEEQMEISSKVKATSTLS